MALLFAIILLVTAIITYSVGQGSQDIIMSSGFAVIGVIFLLIWLAQRGRS